MIAPVPTGEHYHSTIPMSLRRAIGFLGKPDGPWKADISELEAVLGLWLWSLKASPYEKTDKEPRMSRILQAYSSAGRVDDGIKEMKKEMTEMWERRDESKIGRGRGVLFWERQCLRFMPLEVNSPTRCKENLCAEPNCDCGQVQNATGRGV